MNKCKEFYRKRHEIQLVGIDDVLLGRSIEPRDEEEMD
jgi:hypothetical protein